MLFDAHNPDKATLEDCLQAEERDDIRQSIAHATFSMRGNKITNVCWKADSEYDCLLAHFFRAVLYHYLSFLKLYIMKQKYYVRKNLTLNTYRSKAGIMYRKVVLDFGIGTHIYNRPDSSDDEP